MKIWSRANFSSNIFRLIQHNFHVVSVYALFHPTFHSHAVISNVNTRRWPCISCGEIRSSINSFEVLHILPKYFFKCVKILHSEFPYYVLERTQLMSPLVFYLGVAFLHQSLPALIVSLAKACPSPSLIWHRMKEWMELNVGWNMLDDTYKRYKLSFNIPPKFIQLLIQHVG